jgi:hypothetical protein
MLILLEISGEIKGERLRFVEAMKEATAINVQRGFPTSKLSCRLIMPVVHVEHFKQDLSREVMAMTEEVGRLHREKQIIENQISDLFAFYSKHKQSTVCDKYYMTIKILTSSHRSHNITVTRMSKLSTLHRAGSDPMQIFLDLTIVLYRIQDQNEFYEGLSCRRCFGVIWRAVAAMRKLFGTTVCLFTMVRPVLRKN